MTGRARAGVWAAVAGVAAAVAVFGLLRADGVPPWLGRLVGAGSEIALHGGSRVRLEAGSAEAARAAAGEVAERTGAEVSTTNSVLAVDLPRASAAVARGTAAALTSPPGHFAVHRVAHGDAALAALAAWIERSPEAAARGVAAETVTWTTADGRTRSDLELVAPSQEAALAIAKRAAAADPQARLGPDLTLAFEERSDVAGQRRVHGVVIERTARLDQQHVANAWAEDDPYTLLPTVRVVLTDEGARRFGELTAAAVGDKLAILVGERVQSLPAVFEPIHGGQLQISFGSGDREQLEMQAHALAASLRFGAPPAELELLEVRPVAPEVTAGRLDALVAVFAVLVGGLCGLLVLAGAWLVARSAAAAPGEPVGGDAGAPAWARWLRVAVSLGGAALVWALTRVPLPGIDTDLFTEVGLEPPDIGLFSLGLAPVVTGYLLVELVALAVPPWRRLRHGGPRARARLDLAALLAALVLAAVQAAIFTKWLESIFYMAPALVERSWSPGLLPFVSTCATLVAATFVLVVLARLLDRFGGTSGISVLLAAGLIGEAEAVWGQARSGDVVVTAAAVACAVLVAVAVAVATIWVLRARTGRGAVRLPTCGVVPVGEASAILALGFVLGPLGLAPLWLADLAPATTRHAAVYLLLVTALGLAFSWLFSRPRLGATAARAIRDGGSPRSTFGRATAASVGYVVAVAAAGIALGRVAPALAFDVVAVAVAAAVGADLAAEHRARARVGDPVVVWPLHRVGDVDAALATLASAGIPAFARGAGHRALWHFFAPFLPISICVPRPRAAEAHEQLSALLTDPARRGR